MIRKAQVRDAEEFCTVLRTSIVELCSLDHKENKNEIDSWLLIKQLKIVENGF